MLSPQTGHLDDGNTIDSFVKALSATTFKKLPMQAPVINTNKQINNITSNII